MIFSIAVFRGYASVGYHYYKFFGVAQLPFDFKCYICDVLAIGLDGALPWSGGGRPQEMERRKVRSGKFKLGRDTGYPIRTGGKPRVGFPLRAGRTQGHASAFFYQQPSSIPLSYLDNRLSTFGCRSLHSKRIEYLFPLTWKFLKIHEE